MSRIRITLYKLFYNADSGLISKAGYEVLLAAAAVFTAAIVGAALLGVR